MSSEEAHPPALTPRRPKRGPARQDKSGNPALRAIFGAAKHPLGARPRKCTVTAETRIQRMVKKLREGIRDGEKVRLFRGDQLSDAPEMQPITQSICPRLRLPGNRVWSPRPQKSIVPFQISIGRMTDFLPFPSKTVSFLQLLRPFLSIPLPQLDSPGSVDQFQSFLSLSFPFCLLLLHGLSGK
jgi:hypothetical protein